MAKEEVNSDLAKKAGTEVTFIIPDTESLGHLDDLDEQFSLNIKYKSAEDWAQIKDKPLRAYYMGMKDIPNEDGEAVQCGVFVSKEECFISGQMTLVEAVRKIQPQTPVQITYRGKEKNKTSDGATMRFDVVKLG
jgi:hypothetical protein